MTGYRHSRQTILAVLGLLVLPGVLRAQVPQCRDAETVVSFPRLDCDAFVPVPTFETRIHGSRSYCEEAAGRLATVVTRKDIEERLPRSAPDALRYEPGVYVQQTGHGQGSAYVRGRTGQQTLMLFDGIRLNNATFRQGPNQYFFTIDARSVDRIVVSRGGASTRYGSDALGGVIEAKPIEPEIAPEVRGFSLSPGLGVRATTTDQEIGGRAQTRAQWGPVGFFGGLGYRKVGRLESGGPVVSPLTGEPPAVPRFEDDGRTQSGTGFSELAWDGRLAWRLGEAGRLVAAVYDYRQFDAPRTDQCPPPLAPFDECLRYTEQFRTLAYVAYDGDLGAAGRAVRLSLSYQLQHERRIRDRPSSFLVNGGRDDVHSFGLVGHADTEDFRLAPWLSAGLGYGADVYHDRVQSAAWITFTDMASTRRQSRGQYLNGSHYTWAGTWAECRATLFDRIVLRGGGRLSVLAARAPADPESGSRAVRRSWVTGVGHAGIEVKALDQLSVLFRMDRSFRAPNLDDLTSRQQTGPGFQFENPDLQPETALSLEAGIQASLDWLKADAWVYRARLDRAIEKSPRPVTDCPSQTPQCNASWSRIMLVNLDDDAVIYGAEGAIRLALPWGFGLKAGIAWAWGTGPNPAPRSPSSATPYEERVPLSRIPPLNGTAEFLWRHPVGVWAGAGLRWACKQDRLSLGDRGDARIPTGGTPGFAVLDLRMGYRHGRHVVFSAALENVLDAAYRYHGSSVNGPGRGMVFQLEVNP